MKKEKILLFILGGLGVLLMAGNLHAGSIERAEIWLNRYQDEALNTYYGFYADIWGTVEEFQSIVLTSPLNDTYPLAPAPGGDHWSYYEEGDGADITSEFVNGPYSFAVTYTDTTGGTADVFAGSDFPAFPASLALTGNTASWESWPGPFFPNCIRFVMRELGGGGASVTAELEYTATSYTLAPDFLKNNTRYEIEVWFVSSEYPDGFKSSVSTLTTDPVQVIELGAIQPSAGDIGGGTTVVLNGATFGDSQGDGTVSFGGQEATITGWSDTEIVLTTPAHSAGAVDVAVVTGANSIANAADAFIYYPDADEDGVVDDIDQCPGTYQPAAVYSDGCRAQDLYDQVSNCEADVDGNGQVGLEEAIRALQVVSGLRN